VVVCLRKTEGAKDKGIRLSGEVCRPRRVSKGQRDPDVGWSGPVGCAGYRTLGSGSPVGGAKDKKVLLSGVSGVWTIGH